MAHWLDEGAAERLGVTQTPEGINVAVFSRHAEKIEFCLFDEQDDREVARLALSGRSGDIHHGQIGGVLAGARYGLRAYGPFDPHQGHRFNPNKLLLDPYARAIDRAFELDALQFAFPPGSDDLAFDERDSASVMPKAIVPEKLPAQERPAAPETDWAHSCVYEVHVRGFTREHPDVPFELRGTLRALACPPVLAHFVKLGVTAVEIMPIAAWIDERHLQKLGLKNRWGYNPVSFGAPDPRLVPGGFVEVRSFCDAFHAAGLEVWLDVVFNHTGESDELGPTLSLRGLDNASYYRLIPEQKRFYANDTGCGHTLALERAQNVRLVCDHLRHWAEQGFDGFRFDLATVLGRRSDGFDVQAPLLAAIAQDPLLAQKKLIAEPWDIGPGGYQLGRFEAPWAEWNDRFRDDVRRFWRGDEAMMPHLATRLAGSQDIFAQKRRPSRGVNFVAAHDGLTLADVVTFAYKHNQANGEDNRDGSNADHAWNHGVEGASDDVGIRAARAQSQRNLLTSLLLAHGTPMLSMGSELGYSQNGNNNAYAQDFAIDWAGADATLLATVQRLIQLRKRHPALRDDHFLRGETDVRWLNLQGQPLNEADWPQAQAMVMLLSTPHPTPDVVAIVVNRGAQTAFSAPLGKDWRLVFDSAGDDPLSQPLPCPDKVAASSVLLLELAGHAA